MPYLDQLTAKSQQQSAGYNSMRAGENIEADQSAVEKVLGTWMHSPDHCKNLMNPNFRNIAVACARKDATTYSLS